MGRFHQLIYYHTFQINFLLDYYTTILKIDFLFLIIYSSLFIYHSLLILFTHHYLFITMTSFDFYCWSNQWIRHLPPINTKYLSDNYQIHQINMTHQMKITHHITIILTVIMIMIMIMIIIIIIIRIMVRLDHHNIPTNTYDSYDESDSSDSDFDTI